MGRLVGKLTGRLVGKLIGRLVGREIGRLVGREIGRLVGSEVGSDVGREIGSESDADGAAVEADESMIGRETGREIGSEVGRETGRLVGSEIGNEVGREMGNEVGREIGSDVGREIGNEVGREIGNEVGREMGKLVGREMGSGSDVVAAPSANEIGREIGRDVGSVMGREIGSDVGRPGMLMGSEVGRPGMVGRIELMTSWQPSATTPAVREPCPWISICPRYGRTKSRNAPGATNWQQRGVPPAKLRVHDQRQGSGILRESINIPLVSEDIEVRRRRTLEAGLGTQGGDRDAGGQRKNGRQAIHGDRRKIDSGLAAHDAGQTLREGNSLCGEGGARDGGGSLGDDGAREPLSKQDGQRKSELEGGHG